MFSEDSNSVKRRRVARACDVCRRKKIRCDGVQPSSDPPSCTNCKTYGHECSFIDAPKKRGPPKGYVEALETRLQRMESIIDGLIQTGKFDKSTFNSAVTPINDFPSPDSQSVSLENFRDSPYGSGTDEEFSGESNGSQSDISEGGHLSMDKGGHTRYIGNSSGVFVLKFAKKIVDHQVTVVCEDFHPQKKLSDNKNIISELPQKKLRDKLLDIYWEKFAIYNPIIDKKDFMEKYYNMDNMDNNMDTSYNHVILLYAILAIASKLINNPDDLPFNQDYFDRARGLLREEFDNATLPIVQSLLLLAEHQHGLPNSNSWVFVGLAIRLAQDMGLHRDSSNWNLGERQGEVRRRVWWACVTFDALLSHSLGRPLAINEKDYDVRYPVAESLSYDQPDSTEIFFHKIKVYLIISRISKQIYGINSKRKGGDNSILLTLDTELNDWYKNLPPQFHHHDRLKNLSDDTSDTILVFSRLTFYTTQILLHRPHIRCPKSKAPPSPIPSLTICTAAASNITLILYRMMKREGFSHRWRYALYAFFNSVTMHIINALSDDERFREVAKQGLRMSVKCLEYLKPYLKEAERFSLILNDLLKFKNINLDGPDDKIPSQKVSKAKDKGSSDDAGCHRRCLVDDAGVDSNDKSLKRSRVTSTSSSSPVPHGPPLQPIDQEEQSRGVGRSEMNYEFTPSLDSPSFVPSTRLNELYEFNEFNESLPPNANTFIPETSSLLFNDMSNDCGLSVPNTDDWMEWSNWTEYMLKLQASRNTRDRCIG